MKQKKLFAAFVFVASVAAFVGLGSGNAFAATKTWAGAGSDANFNTADNWSPSGAPSNGDDLVFDTGTTVDQPSPVNNMSGLSVKSITFSGSGIGGVSTVLATTALTVTESISDSASVTTVTHVHGDIILGGDVTVRGVSLDDDEGSIDLNGNILTFANALGQPFILGLEAPISGTGTIIFDANSTQIQFSTANTYSGTTIYRGGSILTLSLTPNQIFGTSAITIDPNASLSISLPDAANNTTWNNEITIAVTDKSQWDAGYNALFFSSKTGATINIAVPNLTLLSDSRMGSDQVHVNLAGVNDNGYCVEYTNWNSVSQEWISGGSFINGPEFCVLSESTTTRAKAPDTGFGILTQNPLLTLGATSAAAVSIAVMAKRYRPQTKRR